MLLTLWEGFFLMLGVVALMILAAISLLVCDYVIRRAIRSAAQTKELRRIKAVQLMERRKKRSEERREREAIEAAENNFLVETFEKIKAVLGCISLAGRGDEDESA